MKNLSKAISVIICIAVIFSSCIFVLPTQAADARYGKTLISELSNSADVLKMYEALADKCSTGTEKVTVALSSMPTQADVENAYRLFYSDYPEYFWVQNAYSCLAYSDYTVEIFPSYCISASQIPSKNSAYTSKVNQMISGLSGKSDYEKSKILHDRLCSAVSYEITDNDQNAYGALVEGKAVCNGYARAYQHLLNEVGIDAWYISGDSINPATDTPIGHAWNMAKIDGSWYYTDVTWDDQGEKLFYSYFNLTYNQIITEHTATHFAEFLPRSSATSANYYVREDKVFQSFNKNKLINIFRKDNNKAQIYISGDKSSFNSSFENNIESIAIELGATGGYGYSITSLGNAWIIDLTLIEAGHSHSPQTTVPAKSSTCLTQGNIEYYICDCGIWFKDSACNTAVSDHDEVKTDIIPHTVSGWKNNATEHWTECTVCSTVTAKTRAEHTDSNSDYICDTCSYTLPKPDSSGNIVISQGNENSSADENAASDLPQSDFVNEKNDSPTTEAPEKAEQPQAQNNNKTVIYIACAAVGIIIIAVGIFTVIKCYKNKK